MTRYPDKPGWHADSPDTSRAAAESITPVARTLRDRVLVVLRHEPRTADEVAELLRESVLAVRPRLTELRVARRIEDSGTRLANRSGRNAVVWQVVREVVE